MGGDEDTIEQLPQSAKDHSLSQQEALVPYPYEEGTHSMSHLRIVEIDNPILSPSPRETSLQWSQSHLSLPEHHVSRIPTSPGFEGGLASMTTSSRIQTPTFDIQIQFPPFSHPSDTVQPSSAPPFAIPTSWGTGDLLETTSTMMPEIIYPGMDSMGTLAGSERPNLYMPFPSQVPRRSGMTHASGTLDFKFPDSYMDMGAPDNDTGTVPTDKERALMGTPVRPTIANVEDNSPTATRPGRRGKFQCDPCRAARRNYEVSILIEEWLRCSANP